MHICKDVSIISETKKDVSVISVNQTDDFFYFLIIVYLYYFHFKLFNSSWMARSTQTPSTRVQENPNPIINISKQRVLYKFSTINWSVIKYINLINYHFWIFYFITYLYHELKSSFRCEIIISYLTEIYLFNIHMRVMPVS